MKPHLICELALLSSLSFMYHYLHGFIKLLDWKQKHLGNTEAMVERMVTLEAAKGQALAGRGLCFLERGQLKEALRDLHLSLQMSPGFQLICFHYSESVWIVCCA